jgi:hypothetical protein
MFTHPVRLMSSKDMELVRWVSLFHLRPIRENRWWRCSSSLLLWPYSDCTFSNNSERYSRLVRQSYWNRTVFLVLHFKVECASGSMYKD